MQHLKIIKKPVHAENELLTIESVNNSGNQQLTVVFTPSFKFLEL